MKQKSTEKLTPLDPLPDGVDASFRSNLRKVFEANHPGFDTIINTNPSLISVCASYAQMEPRFKFVFVKRDRDDLAVRMYTKSYRNARAHTYSNNIDATFRYIDWYFEMMDLMEEKFPNKTIVVNYEDLVENPVATVGKITDYFNLPGVDPSTLNIPDDRGFANNYREFWL